MPITTQQTQQDEATAKAETKLKKIRFSQQQSDRKAFNKIKPKYVKSYSQLQSYTPYVKASIKVWQEKQSYLNRLNSITDDEQRSEYQKRAKFNQENFEQVQTNLFDIPYNNVQSFKYEVAKHAVTLVLVDVSDLLPELLLARFLTQNRIGHGMPIITVEWGWVKPDRARFSGDFPEGRQQRSASGSSRPVPYFSSVDDFFLHEIKLDWQGGSVVVTMTGTMNDWTVDSDAPEFVPFRALGQAPLIHLVMLEWMNRFVLPIVNEAKSDPNVGAKVRGIMPNETDKMLDGFKPLAKELMDRHAPTAWTDIVAELTDADVIKKIEPLLSAWTKLQKTYLQNGAAQLDSELESSSADTSTSLVSSLSGLSSVIPITVMTMAPLFGERTVHPWQAFIFLFRVMKEHQEQMNIRKGSGKSATLLLDFIDPKDILPTDLNSPDVKDSQQPYRIQVKSITVQATTPWSKLLGDVLGKVQLKPKQDTGNSTNTTSPLSLSMYQFTNLVGASPTQPSTSSSRSTSSDGVRPNNYDDLSRSNKATIDRLEVIASLMNKGSASALQEKIQKISNFLSDKDRPNSGYSFVHFYTLTPFDGRSIFANDNPQDKLLHGYSFRSGNDGNMSFSPGSKYIFDNQFPDIIDFKPDWDMYGAMKMEYSATQLEVNIKSGSAQVVAKTDEQIAFENQKNSDEEKKKKELENSVSQPRQAQDQANDNSRENLRQDSSTLTKSPYPLHINNEYHKNTMVLSGEEFADAVAAKTQIHNLRRRMSLRATDLKAKMEIVGEPFFNSMAVVTPSSMLYVRHSNRQGDETVFSGIYLIQGDEPCVHEIKAGRFTTTLSLHKAVGSSTSEESDADPLGYESFVIGKDRMEVVLSDAGLK